MPNRHFLICTHRVVAQFWYVVEGECRFDGREAAEGSEPDLER